jgi:hypothetical protein
MRVNLLQNKRKRKQLRMYDELDVEQFLPDVCTITMKDVAIPERHYFGSTSNREQNEQVMVKKEKESFVLCSIDQQFISENDDPFHIDSNDVRESNLYGEGSSHNLNLLNNLKKEPDGNYETLNNSRNTRNGPTKSEKNVKSFEFDKIADIVGINLLEFRLRDPLYYRNMVSKLEKLRNRH